MIEEGTIRAERAQRSTSLHPALALAGVRFAVYTAIRPFSDESILRGARAVASASWQVAHTLAMVAFILLTFGMCGPDARLCGSRAGRRALAGLVTSPRPGPV